MADRHLLDKSELEALEDQNLLPCAARSRYAERLIGEEEPRSFLFRTAFQHDRDRIVHARAFRRLGDKSLSALSGAADHRRTRLTHTLEMSQLARTAVRALGLNEDLTEAICLAHDLGSTPFGEEIEETLDRLVRERLAKAAGTGGERAGGGAETVAIGFRRSVQSLRVADLLEKRYTFDGLNLTNDVRGGILRLGPLDAELEGVVDMRGITLDLPPCFEVQVCAWCDRIARTVEDLDDGVSARLVALPKIETLALSKLVIQRLGRAYPADADPFVRQNHLVRALIHVLAASLVSHSHKAISSFVERFGIATYDDFRGFADRVDAHAVGLPPKLRGMLDETEDALDRGVRQSFRSSRAVRKNSTLVKRLFQTYAQDPYLLPDHVLVRISRATGAPYLRHLQPSRAETRIAELRRDPAFARAIADHIAEMTDRYATEELSRL